MEENKMPDWEQQPQNQPQHNVYNPYNVYGEAVGFDSADVVNAETIRMEEEQLEKKARARREKAIVVFFMLIFIISAGLAIYGIVQDVKRGRDSLEYVSISKPVVLYQNSKPENANNPENFKDENGKYTTEGVASVVKPSIVEIYTYNDAVRTDLSGTGSGIVISDDGYIVTNAHVLKENGFHTIHTSDDRQYNVSVVGRDIKTDIAVIKATNAELIPAVLGDSDETIVGEQVIAVGNPAGLSSTVTDGIVSAVNRKIKSASTGFQMNCIQTNADISPGNSGGALVNMYGQVIGITSSKYVSSSYEGLGFAITINEAKPIIEQLIKNGYVSGRFRIGISLIDMDTDSKIAGIEEELGFPLPEGFEGIYITNINSDCDISHTDLKAGDFITEINGTPVKTYDQLYNTISASYGAGDTVPAKCAHLEKEGKITYYNIEFKLMEDTSGNF